MTPAALLAELQARGVTLTRGGDRLVLAGAGPALPAPLLADLRTRRVELLELLDCAAPADLDIDAREERAAIMEFDGGLPRSVAELLAGLGTTALPQPARRIRGLL